MSYERPQSASGFFLQGPSKAKLNLDVKQFDSPSRTASLPDINFSTRKMSAKVLFYDIYFFYPYFLHLLHTKIVNNLKAY